MKCNNTLSRFNVNALSGFGVNSLSKFDVKALSGFDMNNMKNKIDKIKSIDILNYCEKNSSNDLLSTIDQMTLYKRYDNERRKENKKK